MLREAMLAAIEGWHPAIRTIVGNVDLDSIFAIPFGYLEPGAEWQPSRVTMIGDAAHAMLPTLGMGANLALNDARMLLERLGSAVQDGGDLVSAIGAYENEMRELVYPFMRMTVDHDRSFGGARSPTLPRRTPLPDRAAGATTRAISQEDFLRQDLRFNNAAVPFEIIKDLVDV